MIKNDKNNFIQSTNIISLMLEDLITSNPDLLTKSQKIATMTSIMVFRKWRDDMTRDLEKEKAPIAVEAQKLLN